jgi:outer membrane biosynthesis protein TonB
VIELLLEAERALSMALIDRADRLYQQAVDADPRNSIAVVGLARVALERGDEPGAWRLAQRALAIDPENVAAQRLSARLEEVYAYRGLSISELTGAAAMPEVALPEVAAADAAAEAEAAEEPAPEPSSEPEPEPSPAPLPEPARGSVAAVVNAAPETAPVREPEPNPESEAEPQAVAEPVEPPPTPPALVPPRTQRGLLDRLLRRSRR